MSWLDKLLNREATIETKLEVGDASLLRKENKSCALDIFEIQQVTGREMSTNDMYSRPWRHAIYVPPKKLNPADYGIDVAKLTPEQQQTLKETGWTW